MNGQYATIILPGGLTIKNVSVEFTFGSTTPPPWFTDAVSITLGGTVRRGHVNPADVFDLMTAAGFKLNLITGHYERTVLPVYRCEPWRKL